MRRLTLSQISQIESASVHNSRSSCDSDSRLRSTSGYSVASGTLTGTSSLAQSRTDGDHAAARSVSSNYCSLADVAVHSPRSSVLDAHAAAPAFEPASDVQASLIDSDTEAQIAVPVAASELSHSGTLPVAVAVEQRAAAPTAAAAAHADTPITANSSTNTSTTTSSSVQVQTEQTASPTAIVPRVNSQSDVAADVVLLSGRLAAAEDQVTFWQERALRAEKEKADLIKVCVCAHCFV
jgi:hypothetical protein